MTTITTEPTTDATELTTTTFYSVPPCVDAIGKSRTSCVVLVQNGEHHEVHEYLPFGSKAKDRVCFSTTQKIVQMECGYDVGLLLLDDGTIRAIYFNNVVDKTSYPFKANVEKLLEFATEKEQRIVYVAAAFFSLSVVFEDGTVATLRESVFGEVNHEFQNATPHLTDVKEIHHGYYHTVVKFYDGRCQVFDLNMSNEIFDSSFVLMDNMQQISCGNHHIGSLYLPTQNNDSDATERDNEETICGVIGNNKFGQCNLPMDFERGKIKKVVCGVDITVAILEPSGQLCWWGQAAKIEMFFAMHSNVGNMGWFNHVRDVKMDNDSCFILYDNNKIKCFGKALFVFPPEFVLFL